MPTFRIRNSEFLLLDGAMGTELQAKGLQAGENPALWNLTQPAQVQAVHKSYIDNGANVLLTNTFGAARTKLHDTDATPEQIITAATHAARSAVAGTSAAVALDIGPLGELLEPLGTLTFDAAYDLFYEQMAAGVTAGVDLIFIETMTDLAEVRAAILAAKDALAAASADLPIFVTMSFQPDGRTFTGVQPECFAAVATALGAAAVGLNCSMGPVEMDGIVTRLASATHLPIIAKPNAGLPDPQTGSYDMPAPEFASAMADLAQHGAQILGGCCGTSPAYIRALRDVSAITAPPKQRKPLKHSIICSATQFLRIHSAKQGSVHTIGECLNPTGKPRYRQALADHDMDFIRQEALRQEAAGADILDVNVGAPGLDEPRLMAQAICAVQSVTRLPLQIDSGDPLAIEAGLRAYHGRAVVNSVNGDPAVLERVLPLVKRYGAAVVGLTLDENGIPKTPRARLSIARRILAATEKHGIRREDVFIDCLTLTVSAQPDSVAVTLETLALLRAELGVSTVLGISNISFGLPNRDLISASFLTLALHSGLTLPILNPHVPQMMDSVAAYRLLAQQDKGGAAFIARFANVAPATPLPSDIQTSDIGYAITRGLREEAKRHAEILLESMDEMAIIETKLIPALDEIGQQFEAGTAFLPQLLGAAGAAGAAFSVIKSRLAQRGAAGASKATIVLATVKGDIHDIGKNIVKTLLENYGYRVIDLGHNVPPETVVEAAIRENAPLVGLSALMTTTLPGMAETITALRQAGHPCRIMVGGAVLTPEYAKSIGADFCAKDAKEGVEFTKRILS